MADATGDGLGGATDVRNTSLGSDEIGHVHKHRAQVQVIHQGIAQVGHHHVRFLLGQELLDGDDQGPERGRADFGAVSKVPRLELRNGL